jgi:hypothetical protein
MIIEIISIYIVLSLACFIFIYLPSVEFEDKKSTLFLKIICAVGLLMYIYIVPMLIKILDRLFFKGEE